MSTTDKEHIAKQTVEYILQLRGLHSSQMQSLRGQPLYSACLFPNGYNIPHGLLSSDDELWDEMAKALEGVPEKARQRLRQRMPSAAPFTFTHGDLTNISIIIKDGYLAGNIDWEASGYFQCGGNLRAQELALGKKITNERVSCEGMCLITLRHANSGYRLYSSQVS